MNTEQIILSLFEIQAIQFGTFTLKSGVISPIYIDLRRIISFPQLLEAIADAMWQQIQEKEFDFMCGVPYTALPLATIMSFKHEKPMLMRRKEVKNYGTKKIIEGVFQKGQTCLIVEDLITSGSSILETIDPLLQAGLKVKHAVVFLDREQGGKKNVLEKGYAVYSVLTLTETLSILESHKKISSDSLKKVHSFLQNAY